MCVGLPMRVIEDRGSHALCETHAGSVRVIDMSLVGAQPEGSWVLTHLDAAREVIDAVMAAQIADALEAVGLAMSGGDIDPSAIDRLFPDLADRTPELPPHLRAAAARAGADHDTETETPRSAAE